MSKPLDEELDAINAIYPEITTQIDSQTYNFVVPNNKDVQVQLRFPPTYPNDIPNLIKVIVDNPIKYNDIKYLQQFVNSKLHKVFVPSEVCLFELLSELDMELDQNITNQAPNRIHNEPPNGSESSHSKLTVPNEGTSKTSNPTVDPLDGWIQSEPLIDRGSTFIGFTRKTQSIQQAQTFFETLVSDKKISKAAHNISAWRIKGPGNVQYQDCDDDGETAAGGRLLHLLTVCIFNYSTKNLTNFIDDGCMECHSGGKSVVWRHFIRA